MIQCAGAHVEGAPWLLGEALGFEHRTWPGAQRGSASTDHESAARFGLLPRPGVPAERYPELGERLGDALFDDRCTIPAAFVWQDDARGVQRDAARLEDAAAGKDDSLGAAIGSVADEGRAGVRGVDAYLVGASGHRCEREEGRAGRSERADRIAGLRVDGVATAHGTQERDRGRVHDLGARPMSPESGAGAVAAIAMYRRAYSPAARACARRVASCLDLAKTTMPLTSRSSLDVAWSVSSGTPRAWAAWASRAWEAPAWSAMVGTPAGLSIATRASVLQD